jgi:putative Mn2+ efflux pump MntP
MGFLLLGIDSFIACIALGPIISRRLYVPIAAMFGICDGLGFLLGSAFHWSMPDSVGTNLPTVILTLLGLYWVGIACFCAFAGTSQNYLASSRWLMWILPVVLSLDNVTYGLVDGIPAHASVWVSAGEQALSSALLAAAGLAVGIALVRVVPEKKRGPVLLNAVAGGAMIVAAGALRLWG